ncbi:BZ3500_MvSof-1268-A1-R1_Chr4-3g07388 [Microbotryum saponariae]|uniref:BZ3500_MvSof-1268-A1-R1_Chr4-3g07388 protein n=1 Tax=Microbotryum saponariae TaxID=289078 RepID=A0A2X0LNC5_9BASI|nr:BZ3500_MvSof-1268-A1-R1_Chr4-3g07388 [Microbotryum saponariae]SDA07051.1 BZ3501_MvSof-1269-A2-R1_Chr4-2g07097 [Microbotryum saponariae]
MPQMRTVVPSGLNEVLAYKFPPNAYRFVPRERLSESRLTTPKPSSTSLSRLTTFRRSPGEELPRYPLTSASHDPSLVDRVGQGLKRGLQRSRTGLDTPLPSFVNSWFDDFLHWRPLTLYETDNHCAKSHLGDLIRGVIRETVSRLADREVANMQFSSIHKYLGQEGLPTLTTWVRGDSFDNKIALEINSVGKLESLHDVLFRAQKPKLWLGFGSGCPIDLRIFDSNGRSMMLSENEGMRLAKMSLQLYQSNARFGVFYAPPYFVLCELVIENGRTHLLTSEVCSSALLPDEDLPSGAAPRSESFFSTLVSLFMSVHADYPIEGPPEEIRSALRRTTEKLESTPSAPVQSPPIRPTLDDVAGPFLVDQNAPVSLRHVPDTAIICGSEASKDTGMFATRVELECDGDVSRACPFGHVLQRRYFTDQSSFHLLQFFSADLDENKAAEILPWVRTPVGDRARLDRLDLVTELGRGRTATGWTARWSRRSTAGAPDASASNDAPARMQGGLVAKVVSAEYAPSIAREYFIYTQAVPSLSTAAQAYFPKFHGLYRSGSDGRAYVLLLEDVGSTVTREQWEADTELRRKIDEAFQALENEGVYHDDQRYPNVTIRPDGRICLIDWGLASFY